MSPAVKMVGTERFEFSTSPPKCQQASQNGFLLFVMCLETCLLPGVWGEKSPS